jgi:hypothetical protein
MFGSNILDAAIGLLFVYVVLSLICSAAHELLEAVLRYRASDLEHGLRELLESGEEQRAVLQTLYNHPLVNGLYKGKYTPGKTRNLPSYIPSYTFALAMMDMAGGAAGAVAKESSPGRTTALRAGILSNLPPSNARSALVTLVDAAGNDIVRARENIEKWYNDGMDRVSGWYKRRTRYIIFVLGLAVATGINANTVDIARTLANNAAVRSSLVPLAEAAVAQQRIDQVDKSIQSQIAASGNSGLPLGWSQQSFPRNVHDLLPKAGGWLLTAFAVSLGAPFWFDVLNKFVNFRTALKPVEGPKDK